MATGTAPAKRKTNRQFQVLLFVWLMMFTLGVFAGVTLTKKAFGMPTWVQRVLGLEPIVAEIRSKATPVTPAPTIPSVSSVVKPAEKVPAEPPTQPTEMSGKADTSTSEPQSQNTEPQPGTTGMSAADLDRKVQEYNDLLNRVRNAEKSYRTAQKSAAAAKNNPQDLEPSLAQQQTDIEEIAGALQQAQEILTELKRDPQFESKYREDSLALTIFPVPPSIKETKADMLHFLKKRT